MSNTVHFDAMLQMAARESLYRQLDSFPSKRELEKMYSPSASHEKKINKIIKNENRAEKFVQFNKYFTKVAVILFVTFSVTFTPLITAEAVRESIVQTVIEWKDEFASIFFKSERTPAVINEVKIGYMPDGFVSEGMSIKNEYVYIERFVIEDKHIVIGIYSEHSSILPNMDNESSEYYNIIVNDNSGIWIDRKNISKLIISDDEFIYSLEGNINIGEIIEIYKNIEIF